MKNKTKVTSEAKPKKLTVKEQLLDLKVKINNYFVEVRYQRPDNFQITLQAKTADGKDGLFNVPSLLASVLTAQGLGKEVRLIAEPDAKGGQLVVSFYTPVSKNGLDSL